MQLYEIKMIMLINSIAIIRMSTINLQSWLDAIKSKGFISYMFAKHGNGP